MAFFITESCTGCALCGGNCPVKAIAGLPKQRYVINSARCINCGVCGRGCPSSAILDNIGQVTMKKPKEEWSKPVIDTSLCSACGVCVNACGKDSLDISKPTFRGDLSVFALLSNEKTCVGCGVCENVCPMKAIVMRKDSVS